MVRGTWIHSSKRVEVNMANESSTRLLTARAIRTCLFTLTGCLCLFGIQAKSSAQSNSQSVVPQWIWSPEHGRESVPQVSCYFRKTVLLPQPINGFVEIAADDEYELFINGKRAAKGTNANRLVKHNVSALLVEGENLIAVKVTNRNGNTAGLAARLSVSCEGNIERAYVSNPTWRTQTRVLPMWYGSNYRDNRWQAAFNLGEFGKPRNVTRESEPGGQTQVAAKPQPSLGTQVRNQSPNRQDNPVPKPSNNPSPNRETVSVGSKSSMVDRFRQANAGGASEIGSGGADLSGQPQFRLPEGFQVEHVAGGEQTGSLIAMAFNEFGHILVSREGGPLLMVYDSNENNVPDAVRVCCNKVKSCQGILCVSGHVFVIADGPSGAALYRLDDTNRDGDYESVATIVRFDSPMGEHGPHGLALGPDGLIYISIGNHTKLRNPFALTSPHQNSYEGELITPRYEDPRGHASGIKAPGGGVVRVDLEGRRAELFVGGLRNAYDLAFNRTGELFVHDSDMESDMGSTWHRPTRLLNAVAGGEYGWRSGWAKWPEYYIDSLPGVLDTGRGSPTGAVVYDHQAYPKEYRNRLFTCDWSNGRITTVSLEHDGAGFTAQSEPFLVGRPLNVTDIDVGPDGWVYFTTGGRGTQGNLYRITWVGDPPKYPQPASKIVEAIMQPQLHSAWGRQAVSVLRQQMGKGWDRAIHEYTVDTNRPGVDRARALELMHLVGPPPTDTLLAALVNDKSPRVRARAAYLMGLIGNKITTEALKQLLDDGEPYVRAKACEALARTSQQVSLQALQPLLISNDRTEAWAARKLLERNDNTDWIETIVATTDVRLFTQGATAALNVAPSKENAKKIADQVIQLISGYLPPNELADALRVLQLAMIRGPLTPEEAKPLAKPLVAKFPMEDAAVNREMARLMVYCQEPRALDPLLKFLDSEANQTEKLHVAFQLRFLKDGWDPRQKVQLLEFLERSKGEDGTNNVGRFVDRVAKDFAKDFTLAENEMILEAGEEMPTVAMETLFKIPESRDAENIGRYIALDRRIAEKDGEPYRMLRIGLVAMLARGKSPEAMAYLRETYDQYPERRPSVTMGLAQDPNGRNWDYLVRSVQFLEGEPAREVMQKLTKVEFAPEEPELLRQVILAGLRLKEDGGMLADKLLRHWTQESPKLAGNTWDTALPAWQTWFDETFPERPVADLPQASKTSVWTFDELATFIESPEGTHGSALNGEAVYKSAQCAQCHVFQDTGENLGPELTGLQKRFQRREILESIVYPSQVISDQYASKTVVTNAGKSLSGLVLDDQDRVLVLESSGSQTSILKSEIEEIRPNKASAMPEGLLNSLTLEEIADLFAYLVSADANPIATAPIEFESR
jgi:putative heme-binding domain-containing protein